MHRHRIGTAEVESALVSHELCAEAAVVGFDHPVKGQVGCGLICWLLSSVKLQKGGLYSSRARDVIECANHVVAPPFAEACVL